MRNPKPATKKPAIQSESPEPTTEQPAAASGDRWIDHVDELNLTLERVKALSNALFCVTQCNYDFFHYGNAPTEETLPLSRLAMDLCDKADRHVDALYKHIRKLDGYEERTRLNPEGQTLLDEVAHILSVATPAEKAILALGVEGVKQKANLGNSAPHSTPANSRENGHSRGAGRRKGQRLD